MPIANRNTQPPTVGRIVWVWMTDEDRESNDLGWKSLNQPFRAEVLWVDTSTVPPLADLKVTDHVGTEAMVEAVQVFDPEPSDSHDDAESYATWMPYQKDKHDKEAIVRDFREGFTEERGVGLDLNDE